MIFLSSQSNFCRFRCVISTLTIMLNFYGSFFTLISDIYDGADGDWRGLYCNYIAKLMWRRRLEELVRRVNNVVFNAFL